jgi:hypothetical protein
MAKMRAPSPMHCERTRRPDRRGHALRRFAAMLVGAAALVPSGASFAAGPGEDDGARGLYFVHRGECAKAERYLEQAEQAEHRPSWALPLADCYAARGDLFRARDLYRKVASDKPERGWARPDESAMKAAEQKAAELDARIPTLQVSTEGAYPDLEVEIDGKRVDALNAPLPFLSGKPVRVRARARGRQEYVETVVLHEGERRELALRLDPLDPIAAKAAPLAKPPTQWLGARYYGVVVPRFVMHIVADGGTNLLVPGGAFTFTTPAAGAELTVALGYLSFRMPDTPFKPLGDPDTEWEFVGSTLQAFTASVELMWGFPLDAKDRVRFRVGGAVGIGWMALGDMTRVQSYPANGMPGDPATYLKCRGPNDPMGTFRYCNALDKDAAHYPGYTEPDWFHGGIRPALFPWLVLPQLGLSFRPSHSLAIDLDTGVSITGFLTSLGFRVRL